MTLHSRFHVNFLWDQLLISALIKPKISFLFFKTKLVFCFFSSFFFTHFIFYCSFTYLLGGCLNITRDIHQNFRRAQTWTYLLVFNSPCGLNIFLYPSGCTLPSNIKYLLLININECKYKCISCIILKVWAVISILILIVMCVS